MDTDPQITPDEYEYYCHIIASYAEMYLFNFKKFGIRSEFVDI